VRGRPGRALRVACAVPTANRLCVFAAVCANQDRRIERLAGERNKAAGTLAALEAESAFLAARGRAASKRVAELLGADTEKAMPSG
jgi:hypothetical protein